MEEIRDVFKYLASLKMQDTYIVHGGIRYLVPHDLLDEAYNVFFGLNVFDCGDNQKLVELKEAVNNCTIPNNISNRELIYEYQPWIELRNKSREYIEELGFDLDAWEQEHIYRIDMQD